MKELEKKLGYTFQRPELLELALTHPSRAQEDGTPQKNYERLEFLGDAVLSLILADKLYQLLPHEREGNLAQARAAFCNGDFLASLAQKLQLSKYLRMSKAEIGLRGYLRPSCQEDVLEAIIGAIFLDGGYPTAHRVILKWYGDLAILLNTTRAVDNPKGKLQEKVCQMKECPAIDYLIKEEKGPAHQKCFTIEVKIGGKFYGRGKGTSKKEAEKEAAREALRKLLL